MYTIYIYIYVYCTWDLIYMYIYIVCHFNLWSCEASREQLSSPESMAILEALASGISLDIGQIEAKHASNREVSLLRSRGWLPSLQSVTAAFVAKTARLFKETVEPRRAGQESQDQPPPTRQPKKRRGGGGAWRAYVHVRAAGMRLDGPALSRLSEEYRRLSEEDKAHYAFVGQRASLAHSQGHSAFPRHAQRNQRDRGRLLQHCHLMPGDITESGAVVAVDAAQQQQLSLVYAGEDSFESRFSLAKQNIKIMCAQAQPSDTASTLSD